MSTQQTTDFLADLFVRRGNPTPGWNPTRFLEFWGASIIEPTAFEPDPSTYRGEYYYNAITNVLYKKVIVRREPCIIAYWQKASD